MYDDPNILIINDENIDPDELIENYVQALKYAYDLEDIRELLREFLIDAQYMLLRQFHIEQAKMNLGVLEELEDFYKKLFDFDDE